MIKFFRKIRQQLLSENKFSKYLIYAIGEIILVVIGILIALWLNNWNIDQKEEQFELELLSEFIINLEHTINDIEANISLHKSSIKSATIVLKALESEEPLNDSLEVHYAQIPLIPQFLVTKTAYETMKLKGTGIIRNDSLRNEIISNYDNHYVFMLKLNESEWDVWMQDNRTIYRQYFAESRLVKKMTPSNHKKLQNSIEYKNYLYNRIGTLETVIDIYEGNRKRSKKLIDNLVKELKHRSI